MWQGAEELLAKDRYIGPLVKKWGHCSIRKQSKSKYFIALIDAVTSQQLSGKAAATIFKRLEQCVGRIVPENILAKTDQDLRNCGLSWAKVKYIKDLSLRIMNNELRIMDLDKPTDEEVINELSAVKGIGRWTAEMFLMFSLGRPDIFPVDDLGVNKAIQRIAKKQMSKEEMLNFSKRWQPYRTIASWYLWRSLENLPQDG